MSAPLTCPLCGGKAELVTDGQVTHPAGEYGGPGVIYQTYTRHESFVACTRCEFAETTEVLLGKKIVRWL